MSISFEFHTHFQIVMRQKPIAIITIVVAIISIFVFLYYLLFPYVMVFWFLITYDPFLNTSSEYLFVQYVLDEGLKSSSEISVIKGLERAPFITNRIEPVYIYFKADEDFISSLIQQNTLSYEPYEKIPCGSFFQAVQDLNDVQSYSDRFEWWLPTSVVTPACYKSERKTPVVYFDVSKYLLVDSDKNEVYFLRKGTELTATD